jgi:hypothetical protein
MSKHYDPEVIEQVIEKHKEKFSEVDYSKTVFDLQFHDVEELKKTVGFETPSATERSNVQFGKYVKVIHDGEMTWVGIMVAFYLDKERMYLGFVADFLRRKRIGIGSIVVVEPRHIIDIQNADVVTKESDHKLAENAAREAVLEDNGTTNFLHSIVKDVSYGKIDVGKIKKKNLEDEHETVTLHHPHWNIDIEVDKGISELVSLLWKDNIGIWLSCQENRPGFMFFRFYTTFEMERFLNMLVIHRDSELGDHESLYHRVTDADEEGGWKYEILVEDVAWELDEEKDEMNPVDLAEIRFSASVLFPVSDYEEILKYVKEYQATHGSNLKNPFEAQ